MGTRQYASSMRHTLAVHATVQIATHMQSDSSVKDATWVLYWQHYIAFCSQICCSPTVVCLQTEGLSSSLSRIEMPLVPVLAYMESTRIAVNPEVLSRHE